MAKTAKISTLVGRALAARTTGELSVFGEAATTGNTRFANNGVTTTGDTRKVSMSVTSIQGQRAATVSGTASSRDEVVDLVQQAESLAAIAPVNPEQLPLLGAQSYRRVRGRDAATARMDARGRVEFLRPAIRSAVEAGLVGAGFLAHEDVELLLANSNGMSAKHRKTRVSLSLTARTPDGTGSSYAAAVSHAFPNIDVTALSEKVARRAALSRAPRRAEAGRRTVVLEPLAVADLLSMLLGTMDRRRAEEGRSYFASGEGKSRVGERLFTPSVTLRSLPTDGANPGMPFDLEGSPRSPRTWVKEGVLLELPTTRFWAKTQGVPAVPSPSTLHMSGGSGTAEDLLKAVGDGVLVTRFWYNRMLDRSRVQVTGLTRDGTFQIKDGAIAHPINNFRYNDSPISLLTNVVAMGTPQRVGVRGGTVMVVPPLVVEDFNFASRSDAV
jgi:predicted Zn-dependent protease